MEEKYKALLEQVIPITKSSVNQIEKRAGYDFNILIKMALNKSNNLVLVFFHDAIEHLINHFSKEFDELVTKRVDWENSYHNSYELLHEIVSAILQSITRREKLAKLRAFCMEF